MTIGDFCIRNIVSTGRGATVIEAAALKRQHHVGNVLVVDEGPDGRIPIGIVTDRDIVIEVVAAGLDTRSITVGELTQRPVATVREDTGYAETVRLMSANGVRRMPVVDAKGMLVGIIAADDILHQLVAPLVALSDLAVRGRHFEMQTRR
ncbi:MAG: CBS domain-containing protein [Betaproteobacteria bacterium]|nr:CBS domain-containing protein [Betaproteobacteria bacterium]MDE2210089.1 CBS domain-containing protein [Betaproteobacteria bacterium]MDE2359254.1 CBS domain-containing protein [Betaproteobacteria bacterium]